MRIIAGPNEFKGEIRKCIPSGEDLIVEFALPVRESIEVKLPKVPEKIFTILKTMSFADLNKCLIDLNHRDSNGNYNPIVVPDSEQ